MARARRLSVYIVTDLEGVAGVVFYEDPFPKADPSYFEMLRRNRMLLTEEVNAAVRGAFAAGATSVVVHDHHLVGYNIMSELLDKRVELIQGRPEDYINLGVHHPDLDDSIDALVLLGMHAKAGTKDGATPHSLICVTDGKGREHLLSEATMSMAYAGDFGVPCVFVAGDRATVEDALVVEPNMQSVTTKKHYASQLARTIAPRLSRERIERGVKRGLDQRARVRPFRIPGPCTVQIADRNPAVRWPKKPKRGPDFVTAFCDSLQHVPWFKRNDMIDDGWRYPDHLRAGKPGKWNRP